MKLRNKQELIGLILLSCSILPSFMIIIVFSTIKPFIAIISLIITQFLILQGINMCCKSLEIENKKLKEILNK
ncbi:UNVERIFIED_ORG: hypothetical protein B2H93_16775 [Clostridium botulinum]